MTAQLNHTIVWCRDQKRSASFMTEMLGLADAARFGPFLVVEMGADSADEAGARARSLVASLEGPPRARVFEDRGPCTRTI